MADVSVPGYQAFWAYKRASLKSEYQVLIKQYPDADTQHRQLFKLLCDIEDVAGYTPAGVVETAEWTALVSAAEENRTLAELSPARHCSVLCMGPTQLH
jgi:hypothetical protein